MASAAPRPTIRDIARLAGVSVATVSRVLNDRPDVAPATRRAVLQVVERHRFQLNPNAQSLSRKRLGLIAVTVPVVKGHYFAAMLGGITDALDDTGRRVLLYPPRRDGRPHHSLRERFAPGTADGAVLMLPPEPVEELLAVQAEGMPITVIDPREPLDEGIPCVAAANAAGAIAATEHMLTLGHRSIALITRPAGWAATEERREGVQAALAGRGLLLNPRLVEAGDWQIESGRTAAARLLDSPDPPTAIFAFNDEMAIGALRAASERGLRVPGDLSFVGFDDVDRAELVTPQLTTVRQPLDEMGRMAVSLLLRLLEEHRLEALRVELATKLLVRASAPPSRP